MIEIVDFRPLKDTQRPVEFPIRQEKSNFTRELDSRKSFIP